jgi:hypothetical protein
MGKEWKKRHRYFRQWAKSERKDIDTSDNGQSERKDIDTSSLFAHCLKYLCLFFHSLPIVCSIYVFSFTLCPLSEVSMSFLSLFAHCLKYLCLFFHSLPIVWSIYVFFHSLSNVWSIYVFSFTLCPLSEVSMSFLSLFAHCLLYLCLFFHSAHFERKDIDTSDNGQRVK